ncbi:hypothetical protein [Lysinibacillus sp. JNUCC 51]|uniref:hypothetical protein n=1 Tax=Lysinibacillus sp. JNUCC-51 TaxID=2792479 RepID=UPI001938B59B|nr:hypothetical protein JNUCC51_24435 [Lysinibacillus sp. JNUCC-51]
MQRQTKQVLEKAVLKSNNNVYCFKATSHLMDKNGEISLIEAGLKDVELLCSHFKVNYSTLCNG